MARTRFIQQRHLDMRPLLAVFESGPANNLESALRSQDAAAVSQAYQAVQAQCASYHALIGRMDIPIFRPAK